MAWLWVRLLRGTWEPVASMLREKFKWRPHENESTDAEHRGGSSSISVEGPVMGLERRGWASLQQAKVNPAAAGEEPGFFLRRLENVRFQEYGWQKRYDGRLSRIVLWGLGGEIPPGYSTVLDFLKSGGILLWLSQKPKSSILFPGRQDSLWTIHLK